MKLTRMTVGPWSVNSYMLACPVTGHSVLIDPGAEPDILIRMLAGTQPTAILITHGHPDHIGALNTMRRELDVPVLAHRENLGRGHAPTDRLLADGDRIAVGRHHLRVHYTPGHTDDQVCFAVEGASDIVVGDTIFEGGPGKTWSGEDFQTTLETLAQVVLKWPDDAICHPGHGPYFRLGDKRAAIERFIVKDHGGFFGDAVW